MSARYARRGPSSVVVLSGKSAGCDELSVQGILDDFEQQEGCLEVRQEAMKDVVSGAVEDAAVIVVPGGDAWGNGGRAMCEVLGKSGEQVLADAVQSGAVYIGICAGAFIACDIAGIGLDKVRYNMADVFGCCKQGALSGEVSLTRGVAPGAPQYLQDAIMPMLQKVWYDDGPMLEALSGEACVLARYGKPVGQSSSLSRQWAGLGGVMHGTAAAIAFRAGRGAVVLLSPHPELTEDVKCIEQVLPRLAVAAIRWVSESGPVASPIWEARADGHATSNWVVQAGQQAMHAGLSAVSKLSNHTQQLTLKPKCTKRSDCEGDSDDESDSESESDDDSSEDDTRHR